jgi:hypothetical protein
VITQIEAFAFCSVIKVLPELRLLAEAIAPSSPIHC